MFKSIPPTVIFVVFLLNQQFYQKVFPAKFFGHFLLLWNKMQIPTYTYACVQLCSEDSWIGCSTYLSSFFFFSFLYFAKTSLTEWREVYRKTFLQWFLVLHFRKNLFGRSTRYSKWKSVNMCVLWPDNGCTPQCVFVSVKLRF